MAYEVSTTIEIAAAPENVWAVLADLANYAKWHPVYLGVTGQLAAGSTLTITTTHPATGRTMTAKVKVRTAEPDTELRWVSKLAGVTIQQAHIPPEPSRGRHLAGAGRDLPRTWRRPRPRHDQGDRSHPGFLRGDQRGHQAASRGPAAGIGLTTRTQRRRTVMIEPYNAVGLVPTVRGIRKRAEIMRNIDHLSHMVKAASLAVEPRPAGAADRASRRVRCRASTTRCSTSTTPPSRESARSTSPAPETEALGEICREYGVFLMAQAKARHPEWPGPLLQRRVHPRRRRASSSCTHYKIVAAVPGRALGVPARRLRLVDRALRPQPGRVLAGGRHPDRPARHHDGQRGLVPGERPRPGHERRRGGLPGVDPAPGASQRLLRDPEPGPRARQQLVRPRPATWAPTTSPRTPRRRSTRSAAAR